MRRFKNIYYRILFFFRKKFSSTYNSLSTNKDLVIISGMPRGGTTWLMELLYQDSMRLLWEPLYYINLKQYSKSFFKNLGVLPYIPEEAQWEEAYNYFNSLFTGKIQTYNLLKAHPDANKKMKKHNQILIKFCRANMLLPWLTRNFAIKPIYIIRHPLAVIASQYNHKAFDYVGINNNLFNLIGEKYQDIFHLYERNIKKISTKEEFYANYWAINNVVVLSHKQNNKSWLTLSYESLMLNPEYEIKRLMKNNMIEKININKLRVPSKTTINLLDDRMEQLSKWKNFFTKVQITRILDIINDYGIIAYNDNVIPDCTDLGY